jgi:hypothetical protein
MRTRSLVIGLVALCLFASWPWGSFNNTLPKSIGLHLLAVVLVAFVVWRRQVAIRLWVGVLAAVLWCAQAGWRGGWESLAPTLDGVAAVTVMGSVASGMGMNAPEARGAYFIAAAAALGPSRGVMPLKYERRPPRLRHVNVSTSQPGNTVENVDRRAHAASRATPGTAFVLRRRRGWWNVSARFRVGAVDVAANSIGVEKKASVSQWLVEWAALKHRRLRPNCCRRQRQYSRPPHGALAIGAQ